MLLMAGAMKATRACRPSFVIVLVSTAVAGCQQNTSLMNPGTPTDAEAVSAKGTGCAQSLPRQGDLCESPGLHCYYEDDDAELHPFLGTEPVCAEKYSVEAHCHETWDINVDYCLDANPPPPICPDTIPASSVACTYAPLDGEPVRCQYKNRCGKLPKDGSELPLVESRECATDAEGKPTVWVPIREKVLISCPDVAPTQGDDCSECAGFYPETCVYSAASAACNLSTGKWDRIDAANADAGK